MVLGGAFPFYWTSEMNLLPSRFLKYLWDGTSAFTQPVGTVFLFLSFWWWFFLTKGHLFFLGSRSKAEQWISGLRLRIGWRAFRRKSLENGRALHPCHPQRTPVYWKKTLIFQVWTMNQKVSSRTLCWPMRICFVHLGYGERVDICVWSLS